MSAVLRRQVKRGDRIVLGLSGGVDSVVLLDLLNRLSGRLGYRLAAIHVNHQINPAAASWARFCRSLSRDAGVPCTVAKVSLAEAIARGESLEAAAREARYRAFEAQGAVVIALAHHVDDQVETLLLQLLRGAGVRGLASMGEFRRWHAAPDCGTGGADSSSVPAGILRPLLAESRREILAYARRRKLNWVEDGSNADAGLDRNFIRHRLLPLVEPRFPGYRQTLLRVARHFAETSELLDALGAIDVQSEGDTMDLPSLRTLPLLRIKNAVRCFLASRAIRLPNARRLEEFARQISAASESARVELDLGNHALRQYGAKLILRSRPTTGGVVDAISLRGELPSMLKVFGGELGMVRLTGDGISLARLSAQPVTISRRQGGERFRISERRPRRSLKKMLQEAGMPAWQRTDLPLVYCGDTLVCVPGIGIDPAYQAAVGEASIKPVWTPGR